MPKLLQSRGSCELYVHFSSRNSRLPMRHSRIFDRIRYSPTAFCSIHCSRPPTGYWLRALSVGTRLSITMASNQQAGNHRGLSSRGGSSASTRDPTEGHGDHWTHVQDPTERRKIQNKLAQRRFSKYGKLHATISLIRQIGRAHV